MGCIMPAPSLAAPRATVCHFGANKVIFGYMTMQKKKVEKSRGSPYVFKVEVGKLSLP